MKDPIERQDVLNLFDSVSQYMGNWLIQYIEDGISSITSAQPEIINCTECKYYDADTEQCNNDKGLRFIDFGNPERMWCTWAERKEDAQQRR